MAGESNLGPIRSQAAIETTSHSVITSGLWNLASQILPQAYSLIISVAAARFLGPSGMGRQSFIAFTMISLTQVMSEGLKQSLMRSIGEALGADRPGAVRDLVRWALPILVTGGLAGGATLAIAGLLGAAPTAAWLLAGTECVLLVAQGVPWAVLSGSQKWRQVSTVGVLAGLLGVPATIAVLAAGGGIVGMFAVEVVAAGLALIAITVLAHRTMRRLPRRLEPAVDLRIKTRRYAFLATLMTLATFVVWQRSEFFFLRAYSTDREIAFYSIAFAAASGIALLPGALAATLSPAFATLYGAREYGRIRTGYWRAMRVLPIASIPLLAGSLALGPALIRVMYGEPYAAAGPVLLILLSILPLMPMLVTASALLIGLGVLSVALMCEALGGVVTIALNLILVPSHAAIGAAIADVGGQIVAVIPLVLYASTRVGPAALDPSAVGRAVVASAPAGILAWIIDTSLGGVAGLFLGGLAGLVVLAPLMVILRVVPPVDRQWVRMTSASRLGVRAGRLAEYLVRGHSVDSGSPVADGSPLRREALTPARGRLVVYSDAHEQGGAERALGYLIGEIDSLIDVTVVGVDREVVSWIAAQRPAATELTIAKVDHKWQLRRIFRHIRAIRQLKPDVLHASLNSPWSCQYGILAGILSPCTSVVVVENAFVPSNDHLQKLIKRVISRGVSAHVAVGDWSARRIETEIGLKRGSLVTVRNGVPDLPMPVRRSRPEGLTIGTVSRIGPNKGIELIVRALPRLPEVTAVIVGDGPMLAKLRTLARRLDVADRLRTPGFDPNPRLRLASLDVFVLPTLAEAALPLAIVEAMLAELPVVATSIGPISESFLEGETGLLIAPGDLDALVRALERLLGDNALRERIGSRARAYALERFSMDAMARAYERLYRESSVNHALKRW